MDKGEKPKAYGKLVFKGVMAVGQGSLSVVQDVSLVSMAQRHNFEISTVFSTWLVDLNVRNFAVVVWVEFF